MARRQHGPHARAREGHRQQPGQERRVPIRVARVRAPAARDVPGGVGEDVVVDVGVAHAAEEPAVVQEVREGEGEEDAQRETDDDGVVLEEGGRGHARLGVDEEEGGVGGGGEAGGTGGVG